MNWRLARKAEISVQPPPVARLMLSPHNYLKVADVANFIGPSLIIQLSLGCHILVKESDGAVISLFRFDDSHEHRCAPIIQ